MIRFMLVLTALLALTSLAALIANLPGTVSIAVPGHIIDMPLTVLLGSVLALILGALAIWVSAHWLWHLPLQLRRSRLARNRKEGEAALAGGLMALARGDAQAADAATKLARRKMPHQPLPLLMAAQAALLDGRRDDAAANYQAMLGDRQPPQQISLGLEGLYHLARAENDADAAGTYALQVLEVDAKSSWALEGLMTLAVQIGDWPAAEKWLRRWSRSGVGRAAVKQSRVAILIAIGENNEIFINRRQIDLAAVRANVERLHAENPQGGAVIQADKKAATGVLVEIMDQVRLAGVGAISIAAEEK